LVVWLRKRGYDALHVLECHHGQADDRAIWELALNEERIVISKDEDFFILSTRPADSGRLLWLRIGNCRTQALLGSLESAWVDIAQAFSSGQRIVELR
jgi:predicted nuclease of predicted toxin-antitoxin system